MNKLVLFSVVFVFILVGCKKELVDTSKNELEDVESITSLEDKINTGVSVVFFHAVWCEVCEELRPTVEKVSENQELSEATFVEVDYDDNKDVFKEYEVKGFPQLLFFKDGEEQERLVGKSHSEQEIIDTVKKYL